jgi:multidrug efflux pump subunit AcrB
MLTGTLVTAAGFLPVGFAKSSAGEYAGGIFWIVGLALLASWIVAVVFTPYLGLKLLPDFAKPGAHHSPEAIYETRLYRALRRVIAAALRWRKTVVAMTVLLLVAAVAGFGLVQQQFFPTSTRTELFFEMRLRKGRRSASLTQPRARPSVCSPAIPISQATRPMSGRAPRASGSPSSRCCRTPISRR